MAGIAEDAFDALEQSWRVLGEAGLQRQLLNERRDQFWVTGRAAEVARAAEGIKVSRSLLGTANRLRRRLRVHVKKSRLRWQRSKHTRRTSMWDVCTLDLLDQVSLRKAGCCSIRKSLLPFSLESQLPSDSLPVSPLGEAGVDNARSGRTSGSASLLSMAVDGVVWVDISNPSSAAACGTGASSIAHCRYCRLFWQEDSCRWISKHGAGGGRDNNGPPKPSLAPEAA
jgi:hypothetical protein